MSEKKVFVFCGDDCKSEGMTKEQVFAAIEQAINTGKIQDVDTGFVTKIKEMNANGGLSFWVGTYAEYNAQKESLKDCFCIVTDDEDIELMLSQLDEKLFNLEEWGNNVEPKINELIDATDGLNYQIENDINPHLTQNDTAIATNKTDIATNKTDIANLTSRVNALRHYGSYLLAVQDDISPQYHCLGEISMNYGQTAIFEMYTGDGYGGYSSQNTRIIATIKNAWINDGTTKNCYFGATCEIFGNADASFVKNFRFIVEVLSERTAKVWAYIPTDWVNGYYEVKGNFYAWTFSTIRVESLSNSNIYCNVEHYWNGSPFCMTPVEPNKDFRINALSIMGGDSDYIVVSGLNAYNLIAFKVVNEYGDNAISLLAYAYTAGTTKSFHAESTICDYNITAVLDTTTNRLTINTDTNITIMGLIGVM